MLKYLLAVFINSRITVCCIRSALLLVDILEIEVIDSRTGFSIILKKQKAGRFQAGVDNDDSSFLTPALGGYYTCCALS